MQGRTKKLTVIAALSAIAYIVMVIGRIPVIMFLKYDPKDVVITIGGFLYGPLSAFTISAIVSLIEMITVSETAYIGLIMNIISTCSFACAASVIYKYNHTLKGAVIGLASGWLLTTGVMLLWNYMIAPLYMEAPREVIVGMLLPVFLPFNLLKGGLNAAVTLLLYKPVVNALRKAGFVSVGVNAPTGGSKINKGSMLVSIFIIVTCILMILVFQDKI